MKITPINFTTFLEPELLAYWKEHRFAEGKKVEIRRSHNLKLEETEMNAIAVDQNQQMTLLSSIQLIQIPQQENHPALNALLHLPHLEKPLQMLMVFKKASDNEKWAQRIIEKLRILMLSAEAPEEEKEEVTEEAKQEVDATEDPAEIEADEE